jgi:plastocyanin
MHLVRSVIVPMAVVTTATLALTACGDSGSGATCSPSGTELHIAVLASRSHHFTKDCLAAPAGVPFTIQFANGDTSSHGNHSIHIFGVDPEFVGERAFHGTSITYEVPAYAAGNYQFRCDEHPEMNGTFIVK